MKNKPSFYSLLLLILMLTSAAIAQKADLSLSDSDDPTIPSATNPANSGILQPNTFYAYVGAGENLDTTFTKFETVAGGTATGVTITIRGPGGVVQTCTQAESAPVGTICSRTNLTSATTGVWQIDFTPAGVSTHRYTWVINVQSGTTNIPGRVYSEQYGMTQLTATTTPSMAIWYVTDRGFRYSAVYRGYNGVNSTIRSDSVGVRFDGTCNSAYQSSGQGAPAGTSETTLGECGDPYKIFFEAPAADLPATATLWDGSSTVWIAPPLTPPVLSNVAFIPTSFAVRSGIINFDLTNFTGPVTVQIDTNNDGIFNGPEDVAVTGFADNGSGSAQFNGIDGLGSPVPVTRIIGVRVIADRAGEIHFFVSDVEMRSGGLEVTALNGTSAGSDILYWNDTLLTTAGRCSLTPLTDGTSGVSSSGGVHGWGPGTCTGGGTGGSPWGNNRTIDDWTFQPLNLVQTILVPVDPAAWACTADGILTQDSNPTNMHFIDLVTGGSTAGPQFTGRSLNAIAYNTVDNYLYAWDNTLVGPPGGARRGIIRIGSDGTIQELGMPNHPELDPTIAFPAGDIDDNGHYWAVNTTGGSFAARWYQIDLNPGPTFMQVLAWGLVAGNATGIPTGVFINSGDWAWVPGGGNNFWRVMLNQPTGSTNWHLIRFDRATGIHHDMGVLAGITGQNNSTFGAAYADEEFLYVSNNTSGDIYRVDVLAATAAFFTAGPPSGSNDGARCAIAPIYTDFGDAPASYGTLLANNGPRHGIRGFDEVSSTSPLMLGSTLSHETDGQPGPFASSDTDDGVSSLAPYLPGGGQVCTGTLGTYTTQPNEYCTVVSATNTGTQDAQVVGWLDANGSGNFLDAGDRSVPINHPAVDDGTFTTGNSPAGTTRDLIVVWQGLPSSLPPITYIRFRVTSDASFFSDTSPQPTGAVTDGEVEDYTLLVPTAANVSISGRVLTTDGRGITNARVTLTDLQGNSRTVTTNPFGYYHIDEVPTGESYILSASAKRYQFDPQVVTVEDEITKLNFVALN